MSMPAHEVSSWLTDMDGVLVHEGPGPGAEFLPGCRDRRRFLVLTNNSIYTPRDLHARLRAPAWRCRRSRSGRRRWPPPVPRRPAARRHRRTSSARPA